MSGDDFDNENNADWSSEEELEFDPAIKRVLKEDVAEIESYNMLGARRERLFRKIGFDSRGIEVKSTNFALEFVIDSAQGAYKILSTPVWVSGMATAVFCLAFVLTLQMQPSNLDIYSDVYSIQDAIVMRSSADSQPMKITATVIDPAKEVSIWQKKLVDKKIEYHFTYKEDGVIELVFLNSVGSQKLVKDLLGADISGSKVVLTLSPEVLVQ